MNQPLTPELLEGTVEERAKAYYYEKSDHLGIDATNWEDIDEVAREYFRNTVRNSPDFLRQKVESLTAHIESQARRVEEVEAANKRANQLIGNQAEENDKINSALKGRVKDLEKQIVELIGFGKGVTSIAEDAVDALKEFRHEHTAKRLADELSAVQVARIFGTPREIRGEEIIMNSEINHALARIHAAVTCAKKNNSETAIVYIQDIDSLRSQLSTANEAIRKIQMESFNGTCSGPFKAACLTCGEVNEIATLALSAEGGGVKQAEGEKV